MPNIIIYYIYYTAGQVIIFIISVPRNQGTKGHAEEARLR